jgi:hypothetical protein
VSRYEDGVVEFVAVLFTIFRTWKLEPIVREGESNGADEGEDRGCNRAEPAGDHVVDGRFKGVGFEME